VDGEGWYRGIKVFDPYFYGCIFNGGARHAILFNGFEVWRFYGTKDAAGNTLSVQWGNVGAITTLKFGEAWPFGYDLFAPHPLDNQSAPSWGQVPGAFLASWGLSEQRTWQPVNSMLRQVPNGYYYQIGAGDCTNLRTNYMNEQVAAGSNYALGKILERYQTHVNRGYSPSVSATMANLKRPPVNQYDLQEIEALWDDGIPCSSAFEYATPRNQPAQPQVVTCWIPTMRRGMRFRDGSTPFSATGGYLNGRVRYSDAYGVRKSEALDAYRTLIAQERWSRGPYGPGNPYNVSDPLGDPGWNLFTAALTAGFASECRDTTAEVAMDGPTRIRDEVTSPGGEVTVTLSSPDVLQVGGAARPAQFTTATGLRCATADCRPPDRPDVPPTVIKSSSHKLTASGSGGYKECATSQSNNCDFFLAGKPSNGPNQSMTSWFFRATDPDERFVSSVTDASATVTRTKVVRVFECPPDYNNDFSKCTPVGTPEVTTFDEPASVRLVQAPTTQSVISATNNTSPHR
jgi:hypothetical protein